MNKQPHVSADILHTPKTEASYTTPINLWAYNATYVDADFAGGWNIKTSADANNVVSCTGFVITYANLLEIESARPSPLVQ